MEVSRSEGKPHDRLTELCNLMIQVFEQEAKPEEQIKCMIFLNSPERAGIVLEGYDDDLDAMVDLIYHLKAIFKASGKELIFAPIQGVG